MGSFNKKLYKFLESATEHEVISEDAAESLVKFSKSDEYENKGWFSLSSALGGLGAFILCFGVSLIIAKNWNSFADLTKITGFLVLLGTVHAGGLMLSDKGYGKTAQALHFMGAGLIIAGIGLMGQMFQLYSNQGKSFLSWFVMIFPLAFLLRNGLILCLSLFAFILWGNTYIIDTISTHNDAKAMHLLTFNSAVCMAAVMGGLLLKYFRSDMWSYIQTPAMIALVFGLYAFGFSHNAGYIRLPEEVNIISYTIALFAVAACVYLYFNSKKNFDRYFLLAVGFNLIILLLLCSAFMFDLGREDHFKHFSFGWTRKIYYLPLIVSVLSWIGYFALAFWGVIYGSLNHHRWMLNCNIILIGVGVFTRFIDLVGNMLDTGIMFIVCGILLFAIGFALEKWRRKLIANAKMQGAEYDR
jgi:uncharacterized membrane protein